MATIGLYMPDMTQDEANEIRQKLNEIAGELGFVSERGPTAGKGNLTRMLMALATGECKIVCEESS